MPQPDYLSICRRRLYKLDTHKELRQSVDELEQYNYRIQALKKFIDWHPKQTQTK